MLQKFVHLFFPYFSFLFQKKGESIFFSNFFQKMFFKKLNVFSKKSKLCDLLSQLGKCVFYIGPGNTFV